jgi:hypothetical protein
LAEGHEANTGRPLAWDLLADFMDRAKYAYIIPKWTDSLRPKDARAPKHMELFHIVKIYLEAVSWHDKTVTQVALLLWSMKSAEQDRLKRTYS